jgi:hypothetical protein
LESVGNEGDEENAVGDFFEKKSPTPPKNFLAKKNS